MSEPMFSKECWSEIAFAMKQGKPFPNPQYTVQVAQWNDLVERLAFMLHSDDADFSWDEFLTECGYIGEIR